MSPAAQGGSAGIVLVGGRSERMGATKAGLEWGDGTLLDAVVTALTPAVERVVVVRAPGQTLPDLPDRVGLTEDRVAGRGPLEGMLAGLRAVAPGHERAVVVAVDMPFMTPALAVRLLAGLDGGADAAVPRIGGQAQPLAAAYRTALIGVLSGLLETGERRAGALLAAVRVAWLDPEALLADPAVRTRDPRLDGLRDIDTPAELADARARWAAYVKHPRS
ncbi:MAG: molybdenum cofactor guanylyltransferase [Thermoleophilia bacterium]